MSDNPSTSGMLKMLKKKLVNVPSPHHLYSTHCLQYTLVLISSVQSPIYQRRISISYPYPDNPCTVSYPVSLNNIKLVLAWLLLHSHVAMKGNALVDVATEATPIIQAVNTPAAGEVTHSDAAAAGAVAPTVTAETLAETAVTEAGEASTSTSTSGSGSGSTSAPETPTAKEAPQPTVR